MAVVVSMMAVLLMLAIGAGATVGSMTEAAIAANHRDGLQLLYAAEAGLELAVSRLATDEEWEPVVVRGRLSELLQDGAIDPRITVVVTASADPGGDEDAVLLQSSAERPGGARRIVELTLHRCSPRSLRPKL